MDLCQQGTSQGRQPSNCPRVDKERVAVTATIGPRGLCLRERTQQPTAMANNAFIISMQDTTFQTETNINKGPVRQEPGGKTPA